MILVQRLLHDINSINGHFSGNLSHFVSCEGVWYWVLSASLILKCVTKTEDTVVCRIYWAPTVPGLLQHTIFYGPTFCYFLLRKQNLPHRSNSIFYTFHTFSDSAGHPTYLRESPTALSRYSRQEDSSDRRPWDLSLQVRLPHALPNRPIRLLPILQPGLHGSWYPLNAWVLHADPS